MRENPLAMKPSLTPGLFLPLAFLLILTNFPGLHVMNMAVNPNDRLHGATPISNQESHCVLSSDSEREAGHPIYLANMNGEQSML